MTSSDQVDQAVDAFGIDSHHGLGRDRRGGARGDGLRGWLDSRRRGLRGGRGRDRRLGRDGRRRVDQRRQVECGRGGGSKRWGRLERHPRRRRRGLGAGGVGARDHQVAVAVNELEHLAYLGRVDAAVEFDPPGEIAVLRIEGFQTGQSGRVHAHGHLPQTRQFAQQHGRLVGLAVEFAQRPERDDPGGFAFDGRRLRRRDIVEVEGQRREAEIGFVVLL